MPSTLTPTAPGRGAVGAEVLKRTRTIGRLEKVGQHAATDMLAIVAACEPRPCGACRQTRNHERLRQHLELHKNLPIGLVDEAFRMMGGSR
jgi:hypothetical protein